MKKVKVEFNTDGKIVSLDNTNVFFEGENGVLELDATFPSTLQFDTMTAYIRTNSGRQIFKELTLTDRTCNMTLNDNELEKGLLKIGFEGQYGDKIYRFCPVTLNIDGFISDDYIIGNKLYTVSVDVDETVTAEPNVKANVENVRNSKDARLKFTIPKGATFTPKLNDNGDLSWSNDGGLDNPQAKNIRGPQGLMLYPSVDNDGNLSWEKKESTVVAPEPTNIKGVKGDTGEKGVKGDKGDTGPMPELANNLTTAEAGKMALDAYQGYLLDKVKLSYKTCYADELDGINPSDTIIYKVIGATSGQISSVFKPYLVICSYNKQVMFASGTFSVRQGQTSMSGMSATWGEWEELAVHSDVEELSDLIDNILTGDTAVSLANFATSASFAENANTAYADADGNDIRETYETKANSSLLQNLIEGKLSYTTITSDAALLKAYDLNSPMFIKCESEDESPCYIISTAIKHDEKNARLCQIRFNNEGVSIRKGTYQEDQFSSIIFGPWFDYVTSCTLTEQIGAITSQIESFEQCTITKYGARREKAASSPKLTRIWNAQELTANAGVDSTTVTNDFDSIYPWSHVRRCNISVVDSKIVINAYEGEPGYTTDGSNGQVAVEIPEFYYCPPDIEGDEYEVFGISGSPIGGWFKSPKMYVGAYTASFNDNKATLQSVSGKVNASPKTRSQYRALAKATDSICQLIDMQYINALRLLFTVEFATLDCQSIMAGATGLRTYQNDTAQISESSTNRIILANSVAVNYAVGRTIEIGTAVYNYNIATDRIITAKEAYDANNTAVYFDGDAVDITAGNCISTLPWINGATDNVVASSGSYKALSGNANPCKYRGIENPWGNTTQYVDGINIKENVPYICTKKASFAEEVYNGDYYPLNYTLPSAGYSTAMGYDERYPFVRLSIANSGSANTYYCDYTRTLNTGTIMLFGGLCFETTLCGLWNSDFFYDNKVNVRGSKIDVARLMWKE